jgi:hypothetical protein
VDELQKRSIRLDINKELLDMQKAFMDQDYTMLSDILLYKINKIIIENRIN